MTKHTPETPKTENFTAAQEGRRSYFERELRNIRYIDPEDPMPTDISDGSPVLPSLGETAISSAKSVPPETEAPGQRRSVTVRDESPGESVVSVRKA